MDYITQEEAKIKIRQWLSAGETDDKIREKLASYGFVDVVINNLLNSVKPETNSNTNDSNPTFTNIETPPITTSGVLPQPPANADVISQEQAKKPKNIFDFKKMKWYEWVAMLPAIFLIIDGGAIGAFMGIIGWSLSLKVIRNESYSRVVKILIVVGITITYYIVSFIVGSFFVGVIQGLFGEQ